MVFAVVAGVWLIITPARERQGYLDAQDALMEDILQGYPDDYGDADTYAEMQYDGDYQNDIGYPDDADGEDSEEPEGQSDGQPEELSDGQPEEYPDEQPQDMETAFTPIPDSEFHSAITGLGILTIERIDLRLPVAEGVDEDTLRIALGRVLQTAQIGDTGNAVIAGHRNYTHGQMFNRLGELEIGDVIGYQARSGELMQFVVFEVAVIVPDDQIAFVQPRSESIITLYTCTPLRTATHRLLVRAQRVPITEEGGYHDD
jgi:LPXTG-site transpeptidase (sortase) family protein